MAKHICQYLQAKKCYIPTDEPESSFLMEEFPDTPFWCLRTMGSIGPDNTPVGPRDCKQGRACFKTVDIVFS